MQYFSHHDRLNSPSILSSRFIHTGACDRISFPFETDFHSSVWKDYILFIHSSIDGYLGWLYLLAMVNNAVVDMSLQISFQDPAFRTLLVVQWLRICLPIQETWVQSLVWEDSTCCRATEPLHHDFWSLWALEPVLCNQRSQHSKKPMHCN